MKSNQIIIGRCYKHYKGTVYEVIGTGYMHNDTVKRTPYVLYRNILSSTMHAYMRTYNEFIETIDEEGTPRFVLLPPGKSY